ELAPKLIETDSTPLELFSREEEETGKNTVDNSVDKKNNPEKIEWVLSQPSAPIDSVPASQLKQQPQQQQKNQTNQNNSSVSAAHGGYLAKPSNIYAEPKKDESIQERLPVNEPVPNTKGRSIQDDDDSNELHLVFKDDIPAADEPRARHTLPPVD